MTFVRVCVCGQRTVYRSQFSLSTMWVLGSSSGGQVPWPLLNMERFMICTSFLHRGHANLCAVSVFIYVLPMPAPNRLMLICSSVLICFEMKITYQNFPFIEKISNPENLIPYPNYHRPPKLPIIPCTLAQVVLWDLQAAEAHHLRPSGASLGQIQK